MKTDYIGVSSVAAHNIVHYKTWHTVAGIDARSDGRHWRGK